MKLLDMIVCDDIRQEIGGKQSLIGVYSDLIISFPTGLVQWPINLKIGIFIRFKLEDKDILPDAFEIDCYHNTTKFFNFNGNLEFPEETKYFNLILVNNSFLIVGIGEITFEIIFKKNNQKIFSISPDYSLKITCNTASNVS